jgi:uncharacterized protein (TIGR02246 family)
MASGGGAGAAPAAESIRRELEAQYQRMVRAYQERDPEAVLALQSPDLVTELPTGDRWHRDDVAAYVRASFAQVEKTLDLSFDIQALEVRGDTATATIHQHWNRMQQKGGQLRRVETSAVQRESWVRTPEGWRLIHIADVRPGAWFVDGKRVDSSKPYDPNAPPYVPPVFYQEATWSPDGVSLLLSWYQDGRWRIDRIRADGSGRVQLTDGSDCWTSCSPDGKHFAFHSQRDDRGEIYVANMDGTGAHAISRNPARESTPAWSPDGSKIAFISDRDGRGQLYVMRTEGSGQTRLGDGPGVESNPSWSPDGHWLVFFTTENKEDWVCIVGADGSGRRRIAHGDFPSWSPNGGKILYDRDHTLYTISPEGKDEKVLVRDAFAGRWSADGKHIAFIRGRWPVSAVYVANADGTGEHALAPPTP